MPALLSVCISSRALFIVIMLCIIFWLKAICGEPFVHDLPVLELRYRSLRKGSLTNHPSGLTRRLPLVLSYRPEGWTHVGERGRH